LSFAVNVDDVMLLLPLLGIARMVTGSLGIGMQQSKVCGKLVPESPQDIAPKR
jgi:hypothetical protein